MSCFSVVFLALEVDQMSYECLIALNFGLTRLWAINYFSTKFVLKTTVNNRDLFADRQKRTHTHTHTLAQTETNTPLHIGGVNGTFEPLMKQTI